MKQRLIVIGVLAVLFAVFVVPVVLGDGPTADRLGRAELRYLEGMIDHHQMALDMAADCVDREISDALRAECEAVIAAQQPEIEQMQAWLLEWYNVNYTPMSMAAMDMAPGQPDIGGMMAPMMGMMDSMMGMDMHDDMRGMMTQMHGMMSAMGMMHPDSVPDAVGPMMGLMDEFMGMDVPGGMRDMMNQVRGMMSMMGMMYGRTPVPQTGHGGHGGMGHGGSTLRDEPHTDPAMMMGMFAGFNRLDGVEYEIAWLESMIDHHDDAIHMSQRLLARGATGHAELRTLAQAIIDAQSAEIARYEELIETLKAG